MDKKTQAILDLLNKNGNVILPAKSGSNIKKIPSGNLYIDIATKGGFPQGKIIRIIGNLSASKTQTCLRFFATNQNRCHNCWDDKPVCKCGKYEPFKMVYVDLENTLDPQWAEMNGVVIDEENPRFFRVTPQSGEQAVDVIDALIRKRFASVIIVDSLAALVPTIELEKASQEGVGGQVGIHARIINSAMRKWINALISDGDAPAPIVICINQIRLTTDTYNPETTPGGKGQGFASSLDIRLERKKFLTNKGKTKTLGDKNSEHGENVAQLVQFHIPKSKISPPGASGEYWIFHDNYPEMGKVIGDYDYGPSLMEYALRYGVITKVKSEYIVADTGQVLGTKKDEVGEAIQKDRQLLAELSEKIRLKV